MAHSLVERYDLIALEDLRIPNMVGNRHLAKSILDSGWGYFRTHLAPKAAEAGRLSLDRDINAARNILRAGRARWEATSALAGVAREAAPL